MIIYSNLNIQADNKFSWINDWIGFFFLISTIVINIPQFLKIYRRKSSHGISIWYMFLGYTAVFLSWVNSITFYINSWWDCSGTKACAEGFVGLVIILTQWVLFLFSYLLFLYYLNQPAVRLYYSKISRRSLSWGTFVLSQVIGTVSLATTLILLARYNFRPSNPPSLDLTAWSTTLEFLILVLFLSHYLPQLYETYRIKRAGSISLISLGITCPGSYCWTIYLAVQGYILPNHQASNPMVWVPYLIVAIMQTVLLLMGIYYEYREKQKNQQKNQSNQPPNQNDPLINPAVDILVNSSNHLSHQTSQVVFWGDEQFL